MEEKNSIPRKLAISDKDMRGKKKSSLNVENLEKKGHTIPQTEEKAVWHWQNDGR